MLAILLLATCREASAETASDREYALAASGLFANQWRNAIHDAVNAVVED